MDETTTDVRTDLTLSRSALSALKTGLGIARRENRTADAHGDRANDDDPVTDEEINSLLERLNTAGDTRADLEIDARDLTVAWDGAAAYCEAAGQSSTSLARLEGSLIDAEIRLEAAAADEDEDDDENSSEKALAADDVGFNAHAIAAAWEAAEDLPVCVAVAVANEFSDYSVTALDGEESDRDVVFHDAEVLVEEKAVGVCDREVAEKYAPVYVELDRPDGKVLAVTPAQVMRYSPPPSAGLERLSVEEVREDVRRCESGSCCNNFTPYRSADGRRYCLTHAPEVEAAERCGTSLD